jgi:CubicO group peptidase (beta-lactamase class C family)
MMPRLTLALLLLNLVPGASAATPACQFEAVASGPQKIGNWIDKHNWLDLENRRVTLPAGNTFMPARRLRAAAGSEALRPAANAIDLDSPKTIDPLDGRERNLGFLLDSRLNADGVLVLHNGRILAERYRNGLRPEDPRLLLQATRPLLNLLGTISIAQGKLAADKAVSRYLPALSGQPGVRKLAVQRLLENDESRDWSDEELASWRRAGGWSADQDERGIRAWLSQPGLWDKAQPDLERPLATALPDDDLLAWLLAESNAMPLAELFCSHLFSRQRPEHSVLWLTDSQGVELAGGLALSLRDFGRLGNLLLETRSNRNRSRIPTWLIETLTASAGLRTPAIPGLAKGSEARYGFIHLGGEPNRVALLGANGSSLYIDFDRRLVIALYASHPARNSAALLASLEQFWKTVSLASRTPSKP